MFSNLSFSNDIYFVLEMKSTWPLKISHAKEVERVVTAILHNVGKSQARIHKCRYNGIRLYKMMQTC
jgi:hypothetical protein